MIVLPVPGGPASDHDRPGLESAVKHQVESRDTPVVSFTFGSASCR